MFQIWPTPARTATRKTRRAGLHSRRRSAVLRSSFVVRDSARGSRHGPPPCLEGRGAQASEVRHQKNLSRAEGGRRDRQPRRLGAARQRREPSQRADGEIDEAKPSPPGVERAGPVRHPRWSPTGFHPVQQTGCHGRASASADQAVEESWSALMTICQRVEA
jgi:hypothetical protein